MLLMKIINIFVTLKYLKISQITWRLRLKLRRRMVVDIVEPLVKKLVLLSSKKNIVHKSSSF